MPSDPASPAAFDVGLLSPVSAGLDASVGDDAVLAALVESELALRRVVLRRRGGPDAGQPDAAEPDAPRLDAADLARRAVAGGNPVIPLAAELARHPELDGVHEGATSQDILDTALMLVSARARTGILADADAAVVRLRALAHEHRDTVAAARTLTQHAVPTTLGARFAGWARGLERALERLRSVETPVQFGGAGGTLAASVERLGDAAAEVPADLAVELGLDAPAAPWHTQRWPVTELGDALVQLIDALGKIATDVATLSRTEIGELAEGEGGGSSAMPQKRNPTRSVLIRSAAIRAPQLGATLHAASALAADERPDGAWHAEWPTLRELLRLGLGVSAHARALADGLVVDTAAVAHNLALTRGLILSERLSADGRIPRADLADIVERVRAGASLETVLAERGLDADLADPARYTGVAARLADAPTAREESNDA